MDERQFEKPLRLLFVRLGLREELLRFLFARLGLHEQLNGLLTHLVGFLLVRLRLLEQQQGLLFVRLRQAQGPLRFPFMLASVAGRRGRFDFALRRLLGVLRRLFLMLRRALIVLPGALLCYPAIIPLSRRTRCSERHTGLRLFRSEQGNLATACAIWNNGGPVSRIQSSVSINSRARPVCPGHQWKRDSR